MEYIVYKASPKALMKGVLKEDDRLILLGDGSALRYANGTIVQSDLMYRRKDSHLIEANEPVPQMLKVSKQEADHIKDNAIKLPIKSLQCL